MKAEERLIRLSIPDEKYNMPVEQLDLSVRTMNCLRRSNIATVGELIAKGPKELLKLRNFGHKSFLEIQEHLASIGLSLTPQTELDEEGEVPDKVRDLANQVQANGKYHCEIDGAERYGEVLRELAQSNAEILEAQLQHISLEQHFIDLIRGVENEDQVARPQESD